VLGTVTEAFSRGYDIVVIEDLVATTSPDGGKSSLLFNALHVCGMPLTMLTILIWAISVTGL
jgi:nicotinamidase-related amidase